MPLNSHKMPDSVISILRDLPEDKDSYADKDAAYQTKVSLYDAKCKGCPFVHIEVKHTNAWDNSKPKEFNDIDKALEYVMHSPVPCVIKRMCSYPPDVGERYGKPVYPTLTEIIMNKCDFWDNKTIPAEENNFTDELLEAYIEYREGKIPK